MKSNIEYWNHKVWLTEFKISTHERQGFKELRQAVFHNTLEIVKQGGYKIFNQDINIDNQTNEELLKNTVFYEAPKTVTHVPAKHTQNISVINADCLETANLLQQAGYNPIVLNMANDQTPGGAVKTGAGAQEENIFRRSNLFVSMYQYVLSGEKHLIPTHPKYKYPLNPRTGGIYSPNVTVFRGIENVGYCLLEKPYKLSFVSVAAMYSPPTVQEGRNFFLTQEAIDITKEKMRSIFRIAIGNYHDVAVLSAFGCGAFRNPPEHIAKLFKQVLNEEEFKNKLKLIIFAIIDDHNAWRKHNPDGNLMPFLKEFC